MESHENFLNDLPSSLGLQETMEGVGSTGPLVARPIISPTLLSSSHILDSTGHRHCDFLLWGLCTYLGVSSIFSPPVGFGPKCVVARVQVCPTSPTGLELRLQTPSLPSRPECLFSSLSAQGVTGGSCLPPNLSIPHLGCGS